MARQRYMVNGRCLHINLSACGLVVVVVGLQLERGVASRHTDDQFMCVVVFAAFISSLAENQEGEIMCAERCCWFDTFAILFVLRDA